MLRVRFAPSPTGALHIGGARTALFNYLLARKSAGKFVLRIDDTDKERSLPEHEKDIIQNLSWLGLSWDEGPDVGGPAKFYRQSERADLHRQAAQALVSKNFAYRDKEGSTRLRYPDEDIVVEDIVCGRCVFPPNSLGPEPVLVRSDGTPTYHLASVADDIAMEITHVVRGQDHLTNTAKHVLICRGLEAKLPQFAHLPLILGSDGSKLSKRNSSGLTSVSEFRQAGYLPEALINFLLLLGWSHPEAKEHLSLEDAVGVFSLERIGKTASTFELAKLHWLGKWWMKHLPLERIAEEAAPLVKDYSEVISSRGSRYWFEALSVIRTEVSALSEIGQLVAALFEERLTITAEGEARLAEENFKTDCRVVCTAWESCLNSVFPAEGEDAYNKELVSKMISQMKKSLNLPPKSFFQSLRLAVMGTPSGPELNVFVPLLPRQILLERVAELKRRLEGAV